MADASNIKNNIKKFWSYNIFYLVGYIVFLIASVKSYIAKNNLWALINLAIALIFLIIFAVHMGLTKNSIKNYREKLKKHFKEIIEIKDSPKSIALGFAIGTAIAVFPTFGLGALIGLGIILIFKKVSKVSLFVAFLIWNPFVLAPLTLIAYKIGDFLLGGNPILTSNLRFLEILTNYSKKYLLGNLIITLVASSVSYVFIYVLADKNQEGYKKLIQEPLKEVIETVEEKVIQVDEKIQEKVQEAKEIGKKYLKTVYLNYDRFEDREIIRNEQWLETTELLILDELHKMPGWKIFLKGVYDTKDEKMKILVINILIT